jgi:hypothetical protein
MMAFPACGCHHDLSLGGAKLMLGEFQGKASISGADNPSGRDQQKLYRPIQQRRPLHGYFYPGTHRNVVFGGDRKTAAAYVEGPSNSTVFRSLPERLIADVQHNRIAHR